MKCRDDAGGAGGMDGQIVAGEFAQALSTKPHGVTGSSRSAVTSASTILLSPAATAAAMAPASAQVPAG